MENNIVKEVNVDNVIPVGKPKSGLSIQQLDETLLVLYDRLTRINKYPVKDISMNAEVGDDELYGRSKEKVLTQLYRIILRFMTLFLGRKNVGSNLRIEFKKIDLLS